MTQRIPPSPRGADGTRFRSVLAEGGIRTPGAGDTRTTVFEGVGARPALVFTLGIFGVGLLAVPVMAGASAYAFYDSISLEAGP
jgi:hypothetical protein